jgi:hypothetical protein
LIKLLDLGTKAIALLGTYARPDKISKHKHISNVFLLFDKGIPWHFYIFFVPSLWHSRLWSFQGRDTKLERFLA